MGGEIRKIIPAIVMALAMFFASNVSSMAQSWNNDCDFEGCLESNNVTWVTKTSPKIYYQGPESPQCWVEIQYRIRESASLCPSSRCEIEILFVLTSGACFYPYTEPNPPYTNYPPLMDMSSINDMWNKSLRLFLESEIEPCFIPTGIGPDGCVYSPRVHSATCKKIIHNIDGTKKIEYCDDYNSCCYVEAIICKGTSGKNSSGWHLPKSVPDNCHLNNDPDCKLSCESHNWTAPKVIFQDKIEQNEILINPIENGFDLNSGKLIVDYQIIDLLGRLITEGRFEGQKFIDKNNLDNGFHILILNYENQTKTVKFINQK